MTPMSLFALIAPPLLGSLSENAGPTFFLGLLSVCALMVVGAVVYEMLPERKPKETADEDASDATAKRSAAVDKKKAQLAAKLEAKAKKKQQEAERKAVKKTKGKAKPGKAAPADEPDAADTMFTPAPESAQDAKDAGESDEHAVE